MTDSISLKILAAIFVIASLNGCAARGGAKAEKVSYAPPTPQRLPACASVNGSIYQCHNSRFLFEDLKARRVGDVLTVILQEKTDAQKKASTNTSKDTSVGITPPTLFGRGVTAGGTPILDTSIAANSKFTGGGDSSQSNSLSGNITVSVVQVLANGNLLVRGEKTLTLNRGSEVVRVSGVVRPSDVTPANEVYSTQIANAKITYSGEGMVADSSKAGWLTRFFHSGWWPL
ncbi:MAG: flagellar basal body L-ring protein FlgH [bacterium]